MPITHAFVSAIGEGGDANLVRVSNWNEDHAGLTWVRKTADETVSNSTTLQNDDHLLLAVAANEIWEIILVMRNLSKTAPDSADLKYAWTVPAAGAIKGQKIDLLNAEEYDATAALTITSTAGNDEVHIRYFIYIGGGNAGNVQLQWAQNTARVFDSKVYANSFLICYQLA